MFDQQKKRSELRRWVASLLFEAKLTAYFFELFNREQWKKWAAFRVEEDSRPWSEEPLSEEADNALKVISLFDENLEEPEVQLVLERVIRVFAKDIARAAQTTIREVENFVAEQESRADGLSAWPEYALSALRYSAQVVCDIPRLFGRCFSRSQSDDEVLLARAALKAFFDFEPSVDPEDNTSPEVQALLEELYYSVAALNKEAMETFFIDKGYSPEDAAYFAQKADMGSRLWRYVKQGYTNLASYIVAATQNNQDRIEELMGRAQDPDVAAQLQQFIGEAFQAGLSPSTSSPVTAGQLPNEELPANAVNPRSGG